MDKVPYVLVVGDDDVEASTVGVNARGQDQPQRGVPVGDFSAALAAEVVAHLDPDTHMPVATPTP
jgi:threonyl-tRNA synthetase